MSQQGTEQKTSAVRGRLHVDTLHAQYALAHGSSFLQLEHRLQNDGSLSGATRRHCSFEVRMSTRSDGYLR
jgi:hypothetical protein